MPKRKLALGPPWCARVPIRKKRRVRGVCLLACLLACLPASSADSVRPVKYGTPQVPVLFWRTKCTSAAKCTCLTHLLACLLPSLAQETSHPLACLLASFSCARDKIVSCARE